jgi:hypothetical protein
VSQSQVLITLKIGRIKVLMIYGADMCNDHIAVCKGFGDYLCSNCSEDYTLEYELEE